MRIIPALVLVTMFASANAQIDPLTTPLVYTEPGMDKVIVKKGFTFKTVNDTTLKCDLYYPPDFSKTKQYPVVIFVNGIGGNELPTWRVYQDWARLSALHGMIAVNYQARPGKTLLDAGDLIDALRQQSKSLNVHPDQIGLWGCSANVGIALPLAMQPERRHIRALVMYYGAFWREEDNVIRRQDLELLVVRAGLDFYNLNRSLDAFIQKASVADAHLEFINYPEGQHAFDVLDNTERSKEIIRQTLDFLYRKLTASYQNEPQLMTTRKIWAWVMDEQRTDEAMTEFKAAIAKYRAMPNHSPWFNHLIDERNLNQLGYELLRIDRTGDALKVFAANRDAFPESANVYDALGDAYEKIGDKTKAVANAKLALEKLATATNMQPQFKEAIRASAEAKIKRLQ